MSDGEVAPQSWTLDHLLPLKVPGSTPYYNEVQRLRSLTQGLTALYSNIRSIEVSLDPPPNVNVMMAVGVMPGMENVPLGFIECAFHWYSVSLANFARLTAWIAVQESVLSQAAACDYVKEVCGPSLNYRNKISAHFAQLSPHKADNPADLMHSTMDSPGMYDRFRVGMFGVSTSGSSGRHRSSHDLAWSLTELHEKLAPRYGWPLASAAEGVG